MKKLLFIMLLIPSISFADVSDAQSLIDKSKREPLRVTEKEENIKINTRCIDGYKFVIVEKGNSVAIVQVFKYDGIHETHPAKCGE